MPDNNRRTTVVKIGGALVADRSRLAPLWEALPELLKEGPVVIVHGGGPQATEMARRLGHEPRIVHGRRVTTDLDLSIIHWTLRGELNTRLVSDALARGIPAVGISGVDAGTVRVVRRPPWTIDDEKVDFGWVGDVTGVNGVLLEQLIEGGFVPVMAPLGVDPAGQTYNVNADTVACEVARAVRAHRFLLVTESGGVRREVDRPETLLATCDNATLTDGIEAGWIQGGMRVKLRVAFDALHAGVPEVFILAPDDVLERSNSTRIVA